MGSEMCIRDSASKVTIVEEITVNLGKNLHHVAHDEIINSKIDGKNIYELAGPRVYSYKKFFNHISEFLKKTRVLVPVPMAFMKPMINIAEKTPISPLTSEQLTLFEKDNLVVNVDKSFQNLDINPQDTLQILEKIVVN